MLAKFLSTAFLLGAALGCGAAQLPEQAPSGAESGALSVSLSPIGHWHVFTSKKQALSVTNARGAGVPGLDVLVQIASAHGALVGLASSKGLVHDDGGGKYSFELTPLETGAHAITARVVYAGRESASAPIAFDIARDGEEGIRVDAAGTSFVYQIRYTWLPGEFHASDSSKVMRGIPRGADIDWSKPWQNRFDHVDSAREPTVLVESEGVRAELPATYKGLGVYEVERLFPAAELGSRAREYGVRFTFVDPAHGAKVTHASAYRLHALP